MKIDEFKKRYPKEENLLDIMCEYGKYNKKDMSC